MRLSTHLVDPCGKGRRRVDPHGQHWTMNGPLKGGEWRIRPVRGVVAIYQWSPLLIHSPRGSSRGVEILRVGVSRSECKRVQIKWVSSGLLVFKEPVEVSNWGQFGISVNRQLDSQWRIGLFGV